MLTTTQHRILLGLGAAALAASAGNALLLSGNRERAERVAGQQVAVQQAAQLEVLQREMAKGLAELALRSDDRAVFALLAANGITVTPNAPGASTTPQAPAR